MADLIRDAPIGQLIRFVTRNKVLLYPEERLDFEVPASYSQPNAAAEKQRAALTSPSSATTGLAEVNDHDEEKAEIEPVEPTQWDNNAGSIDREALQRLNTQRSTASKHSVDLEKIDTARSSLARVGTKATLEASRTRADLEAAFSAATLEKQPSQPVIPQRTADGVILVDWYTTDDPENPQNWSLKKKSLGSFLICMYTVGVYMGSAIYAPSVEGVVQQFGVRTEIASFGLSLYVLAYGIGPLIFSPLSEIPAIGRNPPYMITMAIFVILCVPTALVDNFAGLLVLRFLQGFFGSPCLATGGASLQDMFSLIKLPYVLCLWALAATCGPALGPVISGFSVPVEGWRWSLWEILWLAGPVFIAMLLFLPETSSANILLRRARRLRARTGQGSLQSQSEIDQKNIKPRNIAYEALVRPIQLMVMDPAIGFTALYIGLCYATYYSFFEVFPLVYIDLYHFNLGEMGLTFLSITVAVVLAIITYWIYVYKVFEPEIRKYGLGTPERRLIPALLASLVLPAGLFLFGWTANGKIYWLVSVVGIFLFTFGIFILFQCVFVYLPMVYPQYAASLFAGNDFARSSLAFAAVQFSGPMYAALGIGPGVSVLGAFSAACIAGIFVLYFYGAKLRAKSRFSAK